MKNKKIGKTFMTWIPPKVSKLIKKGEFNLIAAVSEKDKKDKWYVNGKKVKVPLSLE
jgi:hypothetical protein